MRATEGVSGMIPRQEYEILAFMNEFYRYPEFMRMITDGIGAQGVMDIGASARREIGTKVNCVHDWCIGAVAFGMGRCGLLAGEWIEPDDYVEESNVILKFMQRVLWGKRQDGLILNSQDRYRCQIHDRRPPRRPAHPDRRLRARLDDQHIVRAVQRHRRAAGLPRPLRLPRSAWATPAPTRCPTGGC